MNFIVEQVLLIDHDGNVSRGASGAACFLVPAKSEADALIEFLSARGATVVGEPTRYSAYVSATARAGEAFYAINVIAAADACDSQHAARPAS